MLFHFSPATHVYSIPAKGQVTRIWILSYFWYSSWNRDTILLSVRIQPLAFSFHKLEPDSLEFALLRATHTMCPWNQ